MTAARYPHWYNFSPLLTDKVPLTLAIPGAPAARLYFEPPDRLGVRIALHLAGPIPTDLPAALRATRVLEDGDLALDLSCGDPALFPQAYFLFTAVADEVQLSGAPAHQALERGLAAFRRLLAVEPVVSESAQLGLLGELWLLARIVEARGSAGVDAWVGPLGQPHDFRLDHEDVEVKTTSSSQRRHHISSLAQLVPSPGRPLYLLSLGFQPAPASDDALSIQDAVDGLRAALHAAPEHQGRLERLLVLAGWTERSEGLELTRFVPRLTPRVVTVDASCPRITPQVLEAGLAGPVAHRISEVRYIIDLDDIGVPFASSPIAKLIGSTS